MKRAGEFASKRLIDLVGFLLLRFQWMVHESRPCVVSDLRFGAEHSVPWLALLDPIIYPLLFLKKFIGL